MCRNCFAYLSLLFTAACTTPSIIATQSIQRGDAANNINHYDEAITHYEEYIKVSPQLGLYRNPQMEGQVYRKLAHAYATQGKYRISIRNLKNATAIDSAQGNKLELIEDYRQLGIVNGYLGDYKAALTYLNHSLELNEGMEKSTKDVKKNSVADTYLSLSQINLTLGNFAASEDLATKAITIYDKIQNEYIGTIECNLILGIISREFGNLELATKRIQQSYDLSKAHGLNTARHSQALGEIFLLKGDPENAIRFKLMAVREAEVSNIKPQLIIAYMRLGDAYQSLGDQSRSKFYYDKAIAIQALMESDTLGYAPALDMRLGNLHRAYDFQMQSGSSVGLGMVSSRLGEQYFENSRLDSASIMFNQAKALFSKAGSIEGIAKANLDLARVKIRQNLFSDAYQLLNDAEKQTIQPDLKWKILLQKGIVNDANQSYDSALKYYKHSIDMIDEIRGNILIEEFKALFANSKVEAYDRAIMILLNHHDQLNGYTRDRAIKESFAFNEQSRARSFLDMMGNQKIEPKTIDDKELLDREQLLKLKMQQLVKELNLVEKSGISGRQLWEELEQARLNYNNVLQEIKLKNESYNSMIEVKPPSLEKVQSTLDDKTAIVEYWVGGESLVTWVCTNRDIRVVVTKVPWNSVRRHVTASRRAISQRDPETAQESLNKLYGYLIGPIDRIIDGYQNIIFVPHKDLHFLPIHVLMSPEKKFLIEEHIITFAPSASILYYSFRKGTSEGNHVLGLALGDLAIGHFQGLPGTELELQQLSRLYPDMDYKSGENCSETYLKSNSRGQGYIHIATHGILNKSQPLYSYLLMSPTDQDDGQLTVNEIFGLDLQSKLIVLSACDTGLGDIGDGDDLTGLSRAFMYAGAQGVIVSLWKVDDNITVWLMTRFHQYLKAGRNASEALAFAQRDIIHRHFNDAQIKGIRDVEMPEQIKQALSRHNDATSRNPYYWGPFVLIGNGSVK